MGKAGPREATLRASSSTFGRICSAILLSSLGRGGIWVILAIAYGGLLGTAVGTLLALPVHRRLFPRSQLQPIVEPGRHRLLRHGTLWLAVVGGIVLTVAMSSREPLNVRLKRWVGTAWAAVAPEESTPGR